MNLTSMNGERRLRLTERYMDPPGQSLPDCIIAAQLANNLERVFRYFKTSCSTGVARQSCHAIKRRALYDAQAADDWRRDSRGIVG